nr:DUF262 domain-containing protein [uncultured Haemophilus sp.]
MADTSNLAKAEALSVNDILSKSLFIPDYQRPYKWQPKHVQQLLEDLLFHYKKNKGAYRIGTIIVHNDGKNQYIVDGQQRITTLLLILRKLDESAVFNSSENLEYKHRISHKNILSNHEFISRFIEQIHELDIADFKRYILSQCEMVYIELNDLDEAFQFFDSQNSRGKSLEPYDLLKAYHLRAIPSNDPEMLSYVENWEEAALGRDKEKKDLGFIINLMLFKLRRWQKYKNGSIFTVDHLDTFKGVNEEQYYPYLIPIKAGQALYRLRQQNPFMYKDEFSIAPFSISQTIINGRLFFKYIEHYRNLYNELFNNNTGKLKFITIEGKNVLELINYGMSWRTGDVYVKRLFQATLLYYYDKFGNNDLSNAVRQILKWAYRIRIEQVSVRIESIENAAQDINGLLHYIDQMVNSNEILSYSIDNPVKKKRKDIGPIKDLFPNMVDEKDE